MAAILAMMIVTGALVLRTAMLKWVSARWISYLSVLRTSHITLTLTHDEDNSEESESEK